MKFVKIIFVFTVIAVISLLAENVSRAGGYDIGTSAEGYNYKGYNFKDTTVKAVWREDVYDSKLKGNVNVIMLNEDYFKSLSDPEKAVLGYLASTIGNECYKDGASDVKCRLLTALNLGSQCSESNKQFLSGWFKNEPEILKQVENCKHTLPGANVEKTFDVVKVSTSGDVIKVSIKGLKLNIKENSSSTWNENLTFKLADNSLTLIERKKTD
jgi:hypothetical protein